MSAVVRKLEVLGWGLVVGEDDVPRVRDLELGERLGYERPRKFRELVERLLRDGILNDIDVRPTVGRTRIGIAERDILEYHLTERGALKAIVKSETARAVEITGQVIDVYLAARESARPSPVVAAPAPISFADVHGSRVGETHARAEVASWCQVAALAHGVSVHRVHGALRRQYKVCSVYDLAVAVWPTARTFLESLAHGKLRLDPPNKKPVLRLLQGGKAQAQTSFPWGSK